MNDKTQDMGQRPVEAHDMGTPVSHVQVMGGAPGEGDSAEESPKATKPKATKPKATKPKKGDS